MSKNAKTTQLNIINSISPYIEADKKVRLSLKNNDISCYKKIQPFDYQFFTIKQTI